MYVRIYLMKFIHVRMKIYIYYIVNYILYGPIILYILTANIHTSVVDGNKH